MCHEIKFFNFIFVDFELLYCEKLSSELEKYMSQNSLFSTKYHNKLCCSSLQHTFKVINKSVMEIQMIIVFINCTKYRLKILAYLFYVLK